MSSGFAVSPNSVQSLTTAWLSTPIALTYVSNDPRSKALPASGFLSHVEVDLENLNGCTQIQMMLYYNVTKRKRLAGPTALRTFEIDNAAVTFGGTSETLQATHFMMPGSLTVGTLYLNLRTGAGTCDLSALGARIHWYDRQQGKA